MGKHDLTPFFKPYDGTKRVYISGPMSGYPDGNAEAFASAALELRKMGYAVCSPSETSEWLGHDDLTHEQFLRFDFERVLEADFLVALRGWEASLGARSELLVATRIGTKCWYWPTFHNYDRITYDDVVLALNNRKNQRGLVQDLGIMRSVFEVVAPDYDEAMNAAVRDSLERRG